MTIQKVLPEVKYFIIFIWDPATFVRKGMKKRYVTIVIIITSDILKVKKCYNLLSYWLQKMWQTVVIIKISLSYKPQLNSLLISTRFVKVPCSSLLQLGESSTTAWGNSAGFPPEDEP